MTIVAAQAGYQLALFMEGDETHKAQFDYTAIIAWSITVEGDEFYSTPITADPAFSGVPSGQWWAVKSPNGKYHSCKGGSFDGEADALTHAVETERAKIKSPKRVRS